MNETDIAWMPATEMAAAIRAKRLSPVEATATLLARIERLQPQVNAYAHVAGEQAMAAARRAEDAVMRGDALGPLHGVPVGIKDLIPTRDMPTEFGSMTMRGHQPDTDAPVVTRMHDAGAVILGKTTTSEFGWTGVSRSPLTGITHNPWKHGYNAGASSAGAGAAAAAGLGPLQHGSDGAGSIRMPAHFCGVFGLKPTYGRVPNYPVSLGDYTSHVGPMTRTVGDAALLLRVMAGPHPLDHTSMEAPPADYPARLGEGLRGRRIAFSPDLGHARVDPDVAALVAAAARQFESLGARVEEVPTPWAAEGPELIRRLWPGNLAYHLPKLATQADAMDPGFVACLRAGSDVTMTEYQQLRARKYAYIAALHTWFEDWDLLLTPAVSVAAFPAERLQPAHWPQHDWDWVGWAEFSYPFNFAGNPAASVPCGFTADGLPVGLQIVGRRFDDLGVLQAAAAYERAAPWADHRPAL
ncbi:amidase [Acidisphaera rubrifaciens]|uniref:Amidase n=1 Tax=Acidisphaera rubrifaciens HS-AP3 TaxID=1231350 RepID=A0A0D6PC08_9PROT|nr:amidase family protein [Acidisphaera rubrifaciens]GAN78399.1 amidase [Acidisphaera rubrifaciens HS-AP3]